MKRKFSPSDVDIGPGIEKSLVVLKPRNASPLMVDVKVENVVAENTSASVVELSFTVRNDVIVTSSCRLP